jgi:cytochrome P450
MVSFDPYDPSLIDDPYPTYRQLRDDAPAYYGAARNFWALSRFADVKAALGDHETFCSSQGLIVMESTDNYDAPAFPPGNMLLMDPPEHTAYRRLVSRRFLQKGVAELEPRIQATAHQLIDGFIERGSADLVAEFAVALPAMVFSHILGIPRSEWSAFQQWSAKMVSPAPTPAAMAEHHHAIESVSQMFAKLLVEKRANPADDLLSELATGTVINDAPLSEAEFIGYGISLLIAGNDTTSNVLANGSYLLAAHPDQRARLVAEPAGMAGAIEEILRYEPPVHGLARTLTRDIELHGQSLQAGQKVLLLFASANRDEREFGADAGRFDVGRQFDSHLSFGFGVHYCVGLHLGRLEARIGLQTLLDRLGDYELAADDVHWHHAIPTRPMASLPVHFTPAATVS